MTSDIKIVYYKMFSYLHFYIYIRKKNCFKKTPLNPLTREPDPKKAEQS